jgi:hypothetical protein
MRHGDPSSVVRIVLFIFGAYLSVLETAFSDFLIR